MTAQHKRKVDDHENAQIWHARLGHISKDRIRRLVDSKNLEIDNLDHLPTCEFCLKGKMTKKPFVGQSAIAKSLLDLVHTDVCGPLSTPARRGFSYFITFTMITHVFLEKGFPSDSRRDEVNVRGTDSCLTSQLDNDPKTYEEAMSNIDSDKWLEVIKSEINSMGSNQVWILVDPPKGVRPVGCKWAYKCKLEADGEVTAFKARLVAKGCTQLPGVDFEETYSPVAMAKSIRILLAIAVWYDYEIWQMDVKTASLNGFIEEEIFMDQPEGFTAVGEEQKNDCDPCIYKKISGSSVAYLVLYVDDILLIGNDVKILGEIKAWLSTQFSMDMGEASYILGIKIYRDRSRSMLALTQSSYIEKVLKRFKMEHSKRGLLSMRHGVKLSKKESPKTDEELERMSKSPMPQPYQACAGMANWGAVKSILKYLKRTKDMFFIYEFQAGYHSGFHHEAEYIAASEAAKEAVWMKNYIQELGVVPSIAEPVVIFCDNNGAITQAKEPRSHHRSKHILRRYHLLREMVSRGDCRMDRVSSVENTADPLTKPMSQVAHTQHLDKMGLRSMGDWL
ncbi:UNVERIFIED_CONTAM: Retrovirus-related Pol polyprotein from transposon RE2 [Sesamum latifolium]|uniref:Retrovirus-related Pol polyprotein from transposon RE2 n=1 Tax=Sesamum latifolium TaxID=2727402 RepID=A0AAW2UI48_9LAMI